MSQTTITARVEIGDRETAVRVSLFDTVTGTALRAEELRATALDRAVVKLFGRNTFVQPDSGLRGYGQVFRSLGDRSATSVTNRVSYRVHLADIPASHQAGLDAQAQALRAEHQQIDAAERQGAADAAAGRARTFVGRFQYEYDTAYRDELRGIAEMADAAAADHGDY